MENNTLQALVNDPEMKEIFESFIIETKEILDSLDVDLVELENRPDDFELLNRVFRSFHTVKGTSGFFGLEKLPSVTHKCEDILNKLRKGEAQLTADLMDVILVGYDKIKELVYSIEQDKNENVEVGEILVHLEKAYQALSGNEQKNNIEEIIEKKILPEEINLEEQASETNSVLNKKEVKQNKKGENTIRVDVNRLDELLNIVSELVLGRNRLLQLNSEVNLEHEGSKIARDVADTTRQIDLMTTELQLAVMKTRMVKIGKVFNRFPRLVRDLSRETGKEIQLVLDGEDTELDKTVIEEINDPIVHLIRNSVDHGIETPESRKAAGKNPVGKVKLSAEQEGNHIVINIEDDGKGIDTEAVKKKAIEKGLITPAKAEELSKNDIFNLILLPGFSTAEKVTNVSGRGVGLDVVKTNVTKLRGLINIESEKGKGTKFIIKLPLTLAIIPGLLVQINNETVVVSLNSVIEVVRVSSDEIKTINKREVIKLRDSVLSLIDVNNLLYTYDCNETKKDWHYIVVVGIAEKRYGLKVDSLIGQKEVVIKSLGNYLGSIKGLAGSTIMGDGKVVVILDIAEIIHGMEE